MKHRSGVLVALMGLMVAAIAAAGCSIEGRAADGKAAGESKDAMKQASAAMKGTAKRGGKVEKIVKTDEEWKHELTPEQYRVLRRAGTEMAFTGKHWNEKRHGVYQCAACGLELFGSGSKFDSGTGWPSFWQPIAAGHVDEHTDSTLGIPRTEVVCARCGGHLGHVFDDGPRPTGLRYCINSAALDFEETK